MKRININELQVFNYLKLHKKISVAEAMKLTDSSESTIRRLFTLMEESGKCVRYYGGLRLLYDSVFDSNYYFEQAEQKNLDVKRKIALTAVSLIEPKDVLYLDSGTTLSCFASTLAEHFEQPHCKDVKIFTNSFINLVALQKFDVDLIGGNFRNHRKDFCGYLAEEALKSLHFTKCFLGSDGYSSEAGFSTTDFSTARLNEIALKNSDQKYILMDSSKFFISSIVSYSKNSPITAVITERFDRNFPETANLDFEIIEA